MITRPAPTAPAKQRASNHVRRLAKEVQRTFPDMSVHQHLTDAAREIDGGRMDNAKRHLDAAISGFAPLQLIRHGIHDDEGHRAAKDFMNQAHRGRLLVMDVQHMAGENDGLAERRRDTVAQALQQRAMRNAQPAPAGRTGPDVAAPDAPEKPGSRQFSSWGTVLRAIELSATPPHETAAGRRALKAKGQTAYGTSFPVPNASYWHKALQSVGRVAPGKRGVLAAFLRKRAGELGISYKGTWIDNGVVATAVQAGNVRALEFINARGYIMLAGRPKVTDLVGPKGYIHGWIKVGPEADTSNAQMMRGFPRYDRNLQQQSGIWGGRTYAQHQAAVDKLGTVGHAEYVKHTIAGDSAPESLRKAQEAEKANSRTAGRSFSYDGEPGGFGHINAMLAAAEQVRSVSDTAANAIHNAANAVGGRQMDSARTHLALAARETRGTGSAAIVKSIQASLSQVPAGVSRPRPASVMAPRSLSPAQPGRIFGTGYYPSPTAVVGAAWEDVLGAIELSAETGRLASTPHPFGSPSGPGLWDVKNMELPPYIQNIARALLRTGRAKTLSQAIAIAKGATSRWGRGGGNVHPEVRAASQATNADWNAKRAIAHAHSNWDTPLRVIELFNPAGNPNQARVQSGPQSGQFTQGGQGQPTAHQQHLAHLRQLAKKAGQGQPTGGASGGSRAQRKAALLATAKQDRAKAKMLAIKIAADRAALASASGKTTKGQTGATTAAGATTTAAKGATTASTSPTSATATGLSPATVKSATTAAQAQAGKMNVAQLKAAISAMIGQEHALLQQAATAVAQAAKL